MVHPDTAQLTIGTGVQIVRPVVQLPEPLPASPVTHLYRAATDTGWYAMAAVLNGGSTLTWVRQILGASWQELYACAAREPRADDPLFLPHLHGERTPYLDPAMRAAWTGLSPRHHREDLLRAALEGIAFAVKDAMEHLLTGRHDIPELRLAGGGTADTGWRQMLADVLDVPIAAIDVAAASGLGAASLGARAAGIAGDARVAEGRQSPSGPTSSPDPERSRHFGDRYATYRRRVASLRPDDTDRRSSHATSRTSTRRPARVEPR